MQGSSVSFPQLELVMEAFQAMARSGGIALR